MSLVPVEALQLGRVLILALFRHVVPKVGLLLGLLHIRLGGINVLVQPLCSVSRFLSLAAVSFKLSLTILQLFEAIFQLLLGRKREKEQKTSFLKKGT